MWQDFSQFNMQIDGVKKHHNSKFGNIKKIVAIANKRQQNAYISDRYHPLIN